MIQYLIFWHQEGVQVKERLIEIIKNPSLYHILREEIALYEDDQYILLEIPFLFTPPMNNVNKISGEGFTSSDAIPNTAGELQLKANGDDLNSGWIELSQTEIKLQVETCKNYSQSLINILTTSIPDLTHLQTYHLLQVGSEEDYWFETRIDVDRLKMTDGSKERSLREISSKSRLEILIEHLGNFPKLLGNRIRGTKNETLIFGLGSSSSESGLEEIPRTYMLIVSIGGFYSNREQELIEIESYYSQTSRLVSSNFGKFLLYHSKLSALHNIGYMEANVRSTEIKTRAQRLQREINALIRESQKIRKEKVMAGTNWYLSDKKSRKKEDFDEGLLYNASIYFSQITELLQTVSNAIYLVKENAYYLNKTSNSLGLEPSKNPLSLEKTEHVSLMEEFKQFSEQVNHAFESLKLEIESTQQSLRNTVDVLKTFLEGKQRQESTRSGKTLGLLTIVFACFVFVDMISNYIIYILESDTRSYEVVSETIIAMIITLWPSLIMFIFLYFIVLKKMWS